MDASAGSRPVAGTRLPAGGTHWLPAGTGPLGVVDAGTHWDAVRAPAPIADAAKAALGRGGDQGAVLYDPPRGLTYWLVPTTYAASVARGLPGVLPLGRGSQVVLATADTVSGYRPHWLRPPEPGHWVTDPEALRAALAAAAGVTLPALRPLPPLGRVTPQQVTGSRCIRCTRPLDPRTAVVYPRQPRTGVGWAPRWWYPRAHPECAR